MPNHVRNVLLVLGEPTKVNKALDDILIYNKEDANEPVRFDFNKIVPMPKELENTRSPSFISHLPKDIYRFLIYVGDIEEVTSDIKKAFPHDTQTEEDLQKLLDDIKNEIVCYKQYGHSNWYDWAIANWGTKWNAYDTHKRDDLCNVISFNTAWSTAHDVIKELSKQYPDLTFVTLYADEDLGYNCGVYACSNGEVEVSDFSELDEEVARKFAIHVWQCDDYDFGKFNSFIEETLDVYLDMDWEPDKYNNVVFTRKAYLNQFCTYEEYYRQFTRYITPPSELVTKAQQSKDEHYNDIPLRVWDKYGFIVRNNAAVHQAMKKAGDYLTPAGIVCILKQAVRDEISTRQKQQERTLVTNLSMTP